MRVCSSCPHSLYKMSGPVLYLFIIQFQYTPYRYLQLSSGQPPFLLGKSRSSSSEFPQLPGKFQSILNSIFFFIWYQLSPLISANCFSTSAFQSSKLLLPRMASPTIFPSLSTKKDSGKDCMPLIRPLRNPESGSRSG